jgi:hypothetical protein
MPRPGPPRLSNRRFLAIGISFFPAVFLTQYLGEAAGLPSSIDFLLVCLIQALYPLYLSRKVGSQDNRQAVLAMSFGLLIPIGVFGILAEFTLPFTLFADAIMALFFWKLWKSYPVEAPPDLNNTSAQPQA